MRRSRLPRNERKFYAAWGIMFWRTIEVMLPFPGVADGGPPHGYIAGLSREEIGRKWFRQRRFTNFLRGGIKNVFGKKKKGAGTICSERGTFDHDQGAGRFREDKIDTDATGVISGWVTRDGGITFPVMTQTGPCRGLLIIGAGHFAGTRETKSTDRALCTWRAQSYWASAGVLQGRSAVAYPTGRLATRKSRLRSISS